MLGGVSGTTFYGSLYVDSLWIAPTLRHQGWGTKLMKGAEKIGKERGAKFVTVNTMDWEALPFYKKLGYSVEFTREGYDKNSQADDASFTLSRAVAVVGFTVKRGTWESSNSKLYQFNLNHLKSLAFGERV